MLGPINLFKASRAVVRLALDPTQLDEVFVLADMSEESDQLQKILDAIEASPHFSKIMEERPRIGTIDLDELAALPEGTVGRAYAGFMRERGLDHEDLVLVDGERRIDFLRNHLRESHDLWHVVTGFNTDVAGELGVQAFYLAQFPGPLPLVLMALGMFNTLIKRMDDANPRMNAIARGWVLGRRASPLFGLRWRDWFERDLEEMRRELSLELEVVDAFLAERSPELALQEAA